MDKLADQHTEKRLEERVIEIEPERLRDFEAHPGNRTVPAGVYPDCQQSVSGGCGEEQAPEAELFAYRVCAQLPQTEHVKGEQYQEIPACSTVQRTIDHKRLLSGGSTA